MVDERQQLTLEQLAAMTPEEVLELLDASWPWPLSTVQGWFEDFYNSVLRWVSSAVSQVYNLVKPAIDKVWDWLQSTGSWIVSQVSSKFTQVWSWLQSTAASILSGVRSQVSQVWSWLQTISANIISGISTQFTQVWSWLQSATTSISQLISASISSMYRLIPEIATTVGEKVSAINKWFSDEFIDPFIDWLLKFPGQLTDALGTMVISLAKKLETWLTHESPGFLGVIGQWINAANRWIFNNMGFFVPGSPVAKPEWMGIFSLIGLGLLSAFAEIAAVVPQAIGAIGPAVSRAASLVFSRVAGWIVAGGVGLGRWLAGILPGIVTWFGKQWFPTLVSSLVIGMGVTGTLDDLIARFITPKVEELFTWAESMGPVSPTSGAGPTRALTSIMTMTVTGLASMTLMGEALSPLKHLGMGHVAAMLYDLINYKVLTAAFMGVLAYVYIRTPLTYYYNKVARPNIPDERSLISLVGEYAITKQVFLENMQYHGYPDNWIDALYELADRPLSPYLFRSLAETGILNDELLDRELRNAGYNEKTIPYLKQYMQKQALGELKAIMTSSAITRFKEGLDDETELRQNLKVLGVDERIMPQYIFAANLNYLTDYQMDLISYYKDAYHRRDIEEDEFRRGLATAGLLPERIDPIVARESTKRVAAPRPVEDPAVAVQLDTIRDRRKKLLITREQEVEQLLSIGKEMSYALAIADNDDVALAEKAVVVTPPPTPLYETEEGKIRVDTIRRLRRQRQISTSEEVRSLLELQVPQTMARAIAANDELRLRKETEAE